MAIIAAIVPFPKKTVRFPGGPLSLESGDPVFVADESVNVITNYYLGNQIKNESIRLRELKKSSVKNPIIQDMMPPFCANCPPPRDKGAISIG